MMKILILNTLKTPNKKIKNIEILTTQKKYKLLQNFNDTKKSYPANKSIHQIFEEQVAKTPNNLALEFKDKI